MRNLPRKKVCAGRGGQKAVRSFEWTVSSVAITIMIMMHSHARNNTISNASYLSTRVQNSHLDTPRTYQGGEDVWECSRLLIFNASFFVIDHQML